MVGTPRRGVRVEALFTRAPWHFPRATGRLCEASLPKRPAKSACNFHAPPYSPCEMKFFAAILVYLAFMAMMGFGILAAVTKGSYWLLAGSLLLYVGIMTKVSILRLH